MYNYRFMNLKRGISLIILFLLLGFVGFSQVNLVSENLSTLNVDDLSDTDIRTYYEKARASGIKEETFYVMLADRGLPSTEIVKLKERVEKINVNEGKPEEEDEMKDEDEEPKTQKEKQTKETEKKKNKKYERTSNQDPYVTPMKAVKSDLTVFGSELFTENSLVFEPNLRIPTPAGYVLGPDDELIVNIFGLSEKTYNLRVNEEGNIYIPQVGPLFVNGLTIEQASLRIKSKLSSTIYKAIRNNQTKVQVSLGKIRSIRVTVIGESKKPGTYTVSSLTTLFNLLYLCGGPSDMGSYRLIELIRGNQVVKKIDLYNFLLKGDQKDNVLLQEGDVIRIPYYLTRISLNGNIKHKGKFEVAEGETFDKLLTFCGGFADDAYKASVTIYQLTEKERRILDLPNSSFASYKPKSSDSVVVGKLLERFENKLIIKGAIMRPGEYELSPNMKLKELITRAGGVKEDVYTKRGVISRFSENRLPVQLSFDIDSVMNDKMDIELKKDDSVTIYSIFDLRNEKNVTIEGQVKKPGYYKWVENMTLNDVILTAGGFSEFGDPKNVEIARLVRNADVTKRNYVQSEIITVDLSDGGAGSKDIVLQPFDAIIIKQQAGSNHQRSVIVDGMVINPGRYSLRTSGDRISDLMKRVGGFTGNADSTSVIIRRFSDKNRSSEEREKTFIKLLNIKPDSLLANERIKNEIYKNYDIISIDLEKALSDPTTSENMVLEDGDLITIGRNTNLVKVSGEVYFPTIIPYRKHTSLKYYIQKSGSYTPSARRKGTLVIYADGRAKKTRHFLFFKNYPKVESRSEIFVPQKSKANRTRLTIGEMALIVSSLGIIANVIYNLK